MITPSNAMLAEQISNLTKLVHKLHNDSRAAIPTHTHPKSQITDFPVLGTSASRDVGTTTGTVCAGNDKRLSDARTPTSHTHTKSEISDFSHTHPTSEITGYVEGISGATALAYAIAL